MRLFFLFLILAPIAYAEEPRFERPVWPSHAEYMTRSTPAKESNTAQEPSPAATLNDEGQYVLQLGAYRKQALAEKAASAVGLGGLRIVETRRDQQDWYVLLLGSYKSREDAQEASTAYLQAHPGGSTWVRTTAGLKP